MFGSALFLTGLAAVLIILSALLEPKNNTKEEGMIDVSANGILAEKKNTVDVLIIGDSESYCSFIPMKLWEEYGFTSYVCGTSRQTLNYSEEFLRKSLATQTPKIVVLETNAIFRPYSGTDIVKMKLEQTFSVFRYHNRWKSLKLSDFKLNAEYTNIEYNKGYRYSKKANEASTKGYMRKLEETVEIQRTNLETVKKIRQLCEQAGAELIFVSVPSTRNWNYAKHNSVVGLAEDLGLTFLDLNLLTEEVGIDWKNDTRDKGDHLNHSGAQKVTSYFGNYLAGKNILKDHRGNKAYAAWDTSLETYKRKIRE